MCYHQLLKKWVELIKKNKIGSESVYAGARLQATYRRSRPTFDALVPIIALLDLPYLIVNFLVAED